jgi:prolipoprotein diacylglyceryltransferase
MLPILFEFGPIRISTFGFFVAVSFVISSFILWRSLKDDYPEEDILTLTILLYFGGILGARLLYILTNFPLFGASVTRMLLWGKYPGFSFFGGLVAILGILKWWSKKHNWDFWLLADFSALAFYLSLVFLFLGSFLSTAQSSELFFLGAALVGLIFGAFFQSRYRKVIWYKSGKPGFAALASMAVWALLMMTLEILLKTGIYLYFEKFAYLVIVITALFLLYKRSGRVFEEDWTSVRKSFLRTKNG